MADRFAAFDALLASALRLARQAPSGQILLARLAAATDPAWVSRAWAEELDQARLAACEPIPAAQVQSILRDAWGVPASEVLDDLDPDPAAVTPTSQVHRGELEGRPVAIKVLRPDLAAAVRQDLTLVEALMAPLRTAFPRLNGPALLRELRERVLDELDLEHEATVQRRFHRALRRHPFLTVPAPVTALCHVAVLVSEWVQGDSLWQAADRDRACAQLLVFGLGAGRFGIVHADPEPDNVRVLQDGRLAVLDFGATGPVQAARWELLAQTAEALAAQDAEALDAAVEELGWLPAGHGHRALDLLRHSLGELAEDRPARLDATAAAAVGERALERADELSALLGVAALAPADLWPARAVVGVFAAIARVGATAAWRPLVLGALREGWEFRPPGSPVP